MISRYPYRAFLRAVLNSMLLLCMLSAPIQAAPQGEATADIIEGCNQFIKFSRKGTPPRDADKLRRLGECIGAVRATLAFLVKDGTICPPSQAKLIDAVGLLSTRVLQYPDELKENYVLVIQRSFVAGWSCGSAKPV